MKFLQRFLSILFFSCVSGTVPKGRLSDPTGSYSCLTCKEYVKPAGSNIAAIAHCVRGTGEDSRICGYNDHQCVIVVIRSSTHLGIERRCSKGNPPKERCPDKNSGNGKLPAEGCYCTELNCQTPTYEEFLPELKELEKKLKEGSGSGSGDGSGGGSGGGSGKMMEGESGKGAKGTANGFLSPIFIILAFVLICLCV